MNEADVSCPVSNRTSTTVLWNSYWKRATAASQRFWSMWPPPSISALLPGGGGSHSHSPVFPSRVFFLHLTPNLKYVPVLRRLCDVGREHILSFLQYRNNKHGPHPVGRKEMYFSCYIKCFCSEIWNVLAEKGVSYTHTKMSLSVIHLVRQF
jgi:hypothetical protein